MIAWPVCHRCGAKTVEVDKVSEVFNRLEAVIIRSYRCANASGGCKWRAVTAEKILDANPSTLRLRRRLHIRIIDRIAALFPVNRLTSAAGDVQA